MLGAPAGLGAGGRCAQPEDALVAEAGPRAGSFPCLQALQSELGGGLRVSPEPGATSFRLMVGQGLAAAVSSTGDTQCLRVGEPVPRAESVNLQPSAIFG